MNSPEAKTKQKSRPWKAIMVTTLITIAVTIAAAWFTISRSERQAILAEAERVRNVKNNLVSIIEEHVINQKPVDYIRLIRLIELKSCEEKLTTRITARNLIEQAEYNILNSRYLDFKQKENYEAIFDQWYKEMIPAGYSPFEEIPHADVLNKLAQDIQEGNIEGSLKLLNQYVENMSVELAQLKGKTMIGESLIESLFRRPFFYGFMIVYFIILILIFPRFMRKIRERDRQ
jgi:hypothetical protein